ncbi:MAG: C25 family cysteine peptidase, partial [Candidatus Marinimicrobia bacterium]|nr:C25 family cysteine peptidase [Candidatus Neomarinimicrobiota bacterium]
QSAENLNGESTENNSIPIHNGENLFTIINQENPIEGSNYDLVYLNWVDISYERFFRTDSEYVHFKTEPNQSGIMEFFVRGFNSNNIYVFKNGIARLQNFLITNDEVSQTFSIRFQDNIISSGTNYHVFSDIAIDTVKKIIPMEPIYIPLNEIVSPYIIVAPDSFHTILEPLAEYHSGEVVNIDEIYRQYAHGRFSPYGIKDFFRDVHMSNNGNLEAVLIAMEGEDISQVTTGFEKGGEFIPSMKIQTVKWGAASSDFWYACVDGDDLIPEFSIGRLPASDTEELQIMVDKTIAQHIQGDQFWHDNQLFIAGYETTFKDQSETLIGNFVRNGYFPRRLYIDVLSEAGPYYGGTETVLNYLEEGMSYVNFLGHGGGAVWGDRSIMTLDALDYLFNTGRPSFVTSMTCFTGDVTNPNSLGRRMVAHENGGASAWFGSSGVGWIINDFLLLEPLHQYLFSDIDIPIGEMIHAAKVDFLSSNTVYPDIAKTQVSQFNLTGDPMLKVKRNTIDEIPFTPNIGEADQTIDIALINDSYDSVFFQIFDSGNYPIDIDPQQYGGSISLSDTAESGLYHINISARSGESIVHDSGIFALTDSGPLIHILNVEPSTATYKDSIFVNGFVSNAQSTDSLFLQINGVNFHAIDISSISGNTFTEIIPPQNPSQAISISFLLTDSNGQSHISNEESVTILPLADYTPQSLSFFTDDSVYLRTSIENLYPSPGTALIQ